MSKPSPYDNISISEGGRFVRYEWDVHYLTDEQMETVRKHIETLQAENAKLRELVRTFYHCTTSGECDECPINGGGPVHLMPDTICDTIHDRMRELGVEV